MNADNSTRETEPQIRGEEKTANVPLKAVPNLLVHRGSKIKMQHMKPKSYRLLFPARLNSKWLLLDNFSSFSLSALSPVFSSTISDYTVSLNLFTSDLL